VAPNLPFIDLDEEYYKAVEDFDKRFPTGVPSLKEAESLVVSGDWAFGKGVSVKGAARLEGEHGRVEAGAVLGEGTSSE